MPNSNTPAVSTAVQPVATLTITTTTDGGQLQSGTFSGDTGSTKFSMTLPAMPLPGNTTFTFTMFG